MTASILLHRLVLFSVCFIYPMSGDTVPERLTRIGNSNVLRLFLFVSIVLKFFVGPDVTRGKVHGWLNFQKFAITKLNEIRGFFCFCFTMCTIEIEDGHLAPCKPSKFKSCLILTSTRRPVYFLPYRPV